MLPTQNYETDSQQLSEPIAIRTCYTYDNIPESPILFDNSFEDTVDLCTPTYSMDSTNEDTDSTTNDFIKKRLQMKLSKKIDSIIEYLEDLDNRISDFDSRYQHALFEYDQKWDAEVEKAKQIMGQSSNESCK